MAEHEPKDFRLAKRAYEAFWEEQPQVWFEQLSHAYQMRWVNVVREVLKENHKRVIKAMLPLVSPPVSRNDARLEEAKAIVAAAPKKGGKGTRVDHRAMSKKDSEVVRKAMHYISHHRKG